MTSSCGQSKAGFIKQQFYAREALKRNDGSVKARVHLSKALKGRGDFSSALAVLDEAEFIAGSGLEVIAEYREDVLKAKARFQEGLETAKRISREASFEVEEEEDEEEANKEDGTEEAAEEPSVE